MKASRAFSFLTATALVLLPIAATPAHAATAYASDKISIWSDPGSFHPIVGMLWPGDVVDIDRCTASGHWCRVLHDGRTGWVPASYLVGAAAKLEATPLRSLASPPLDQQRDLGHSRSNGLW